MTTVEAGIYFIVTATTVTVGIGFAWEYATRRRNQPVGELVDLERFKAQRAHLASGSNVTVIRGHK